VRNVQKLVHNLPGAESIAKEARPHEAVKQSSGQIKGSRGATARKHPGGRAAADGSTAGAAGDSGQSLDGSASGSSSSSSNNRGDSRSSGSQHRVRKVTVAAWMQVGATVMLVSIRQQLKSHHLSAAARKVNFYLQEHAVGSEADESEPSAVHNSGDSSHDAGASSGNSSGRQGC